MRSQQFSRYKSAQAGFTLIEMLLAAVIFALVGFASFSILNAVTNSNELSKEASEELHGVQRAFFWIERDFLQASKRQVRVDGEKASAKLMVGGDLIMDSEGGAVSFTHDGWRNPGLVLARSEIQSVSYRMLESKLERLYFNYPDPVAGEKPRIQVLLEGLEGLSFEFYSNNDWGNEWEQEGLPRAIKVTIETKTMGEVERIFLLTDNATAGSANNSNGRGP